MKIERISSVSSILVMMLLLSNCEKDQLTPSSEGDQGLLKAAKTAGMVIVVNPTGGDDTQNILDAFEAAKAEGPGSTVYLSAGTFYVSKPVAVADFDGTFKGAGKDKTIIQNVEGSDFPLHSNSPTGIGNGQWSDMFVFYGEAPSGPNALTICDLTFKFIGPTVTYQPPFYPVNHNCIMGIITVTGNVNGYRDLSKVNVHIYDVRCEGELSNDFLRGYNVETCIYIIGEAQFDGSGNYQWLEDLMLSNVLIERCEFSGAYRGIGIPEQDGSTVLIKNNWFSEIMGQGIYHWENNNSHIEIINNSLEAQIYASIVLSNDGWAVNHDVPSRFLILSNNIKAPGTADGILILDQRYYYDAIKTMDLCIKSNKFHLNSTFGGIAVGASEGMLVLSNQFFGQADYAIYTFGRVYQCLIRGNNLSPLDVGWTGIYLCPESYQCTVIGGDNATNVLDEGTDNLITGVTIGGSPGILNHEAAIKKIKKMHPRFNPVE